MKCPNCGAEIANDSLFCENCGVKITSSKKPSKKKWVPWVTGILAFIVSFIVVAALLDKNDSSSSEPVSRKEQCVRDIEAVTSATELNSIDTKYPDLKYNDFTPEQQRRIDRVVNKFKQTAEAEPVEAPVSYLYTDDNNFEIEYHGGEEYSKWLRVYSNCSWYISTPVASWAHTAVSGDYIQVWCDHNPNERRSDYFIISTTDGNESYRVDFTQK